METFMNTTRWISAASRCIAAVALCAAVCGAVAQTAPKKVAASSDDLPRYSYPLNTPPSAFVLTDDATFNAFAAKVDADIRATLDGYEITDKATLHSLLVERARYSMLTNDNAAVLAMLDRERALEEKPAAIATAGLPSRQIAEARIATGATMGAAFDAAFAKRFRAALDALPWSVAQEGLKAMKAGSQSMSQTSVLASLKANDDPGVAKTGTIDLARAMRLISARYSLLVNLPVKSTMAAVLSTYLAAHTEKKQDIWPAREVTLTAADKLTPVRIAIWDGGVDTSLYPAQLYTDPAPGPYGVHGIGFDTHGALVAGDMQPLTTEQKSIYPTSLKLRQGQDDLLNDIHSPDAAMAQTYLSSMPADQAASFTENMNNLGEWMHGTHVAGIAVRGNPAARLVVVQFNDGIQYLPFEPTIAWAQKFKADFALLGDYFRTHDVRVVNMSWSDNQAEFETWLTKTSHEKDVDRRKQLAGELYAIWRDAVEDAIRRAPGTLFVCAAGNTSNDVKFQGDIPASFHLPNLVTVGAVDEAGEETSFTSYGDTVVLDADGYRVPSYVPGGSIMKLSGTSMASPNVANLAAKLIALNPRLTPAQTIELMRKAATVSPDGRLHIIDPKASVALLEQTK
jgi:subtilisin family serine protease